MKYYTKKEILKISEVDRQKAEASKNDEGLMERDKVLKSLETIIALLELEEERKKRLNG